MGKARQQPKENADLRFLYMAVAIGVILRLYKLGDQSLWGDEALTVLYYTAGNSIGEAWNRIWASGGHPPFYFLTVFHWFKLGDSEFMLRLPSVLFGMASVPVVYALVNRLYESRTSAVAAWIVALSPIHIWYSQEARMYSLQILLALLSTLFLMRAWRDRRLSDYALFAVCSVLGLFTHMATALFLAGQAVFLLLTHMRDRRLLALWVGVFVLIGVAFAPWIAAFIADNTADGGSLAVGYERQASMFDSPYAFYTFVAGYSLGPSTAELHEIRALDTVTRHWVEILAAALIFGALTLLGLRRAWRSDRGSLALVGSLLVVPTVIATAGSHLPGFPLNPRYILPAVIPYWIVLALGIRACWGRRMLMSIPAAALLITGYSLHNHYLNTLYAKQDMRSATNLVEREADRGDVIVISSVELGGPFIYYFDRTDVPYHGYPPRGGFVERSRLESDMRELVDGRSRVWLVLGRTWSSDPNGMIRTHFQHAATPFAAYRYSGVTVLGYDLTSPTHKATNR